MKPTIRHTPVIAAALLIATVTLTGEFLHLRLHITHDPLGSDTSGAGNIAIVKGMHTCLLCEHVVTEPAVSARDEAVRLASIDFVAPDGNGTPFTYAPSYSGNRGPPLFF